MVILNFAATTYFLREAIIGIFFLFILYVIQHELSYQFIMIDIFISLYFAMYFLFFFLTPIQNKIDFSTYSGMDIFRFVDAILSFVYYTVCLTFFLYPYREFKLIAYNQDPRLRDYFRSGIQE